MMWLTPDWVYPIRPARFGQVAGFGHIGQHLVFFSDPRAPPPFDMKVCNARRKKSAFPGGCFSVL
jgi:hypothetical protein